jgi:membrane associated rhomboid family serine protease
MSESITSRLDRALARAGVTILLPLAILAIPWTQELIDQLVFGGRWNLPLTPGGSFLGLFTSPFSHAGFGHLLGNSLAFVPLSWLVLARGRRDYLAVWIGVILLQIPIWLFGSASSHGLSGVVYGLFGYLVLIGWLEKRPLSILLSVIALLTFGELLPSLLPFLNPPEVSWIGHAAGFGGGALAALAVYRERDRQPGGSAG